MERATPEVPRLIDNMAMARAPEYLEDIVRKRYVPGQRNGGKIRGESRVHRNVLSDAKQESYTSGIMTSCSRA